MCGRVLQRTHRGRKLVIARQGPRQLARRRWRGSKRKSIPTSSCRPLNGNCEPSTHDGPTSCRWRCAVRALDGGERSEECPRRGGRGTHWGMRSLSEEHLRVIRAANARQWVKQAKCVGRDDVNWYSRSLDMVRACKAICARCPVQHECRQEAQLLGDPWGVWGGTTREEREHAAVEQGLPLPAIVPAHGTNSRYVKHACRCDLCRAAHTAYERLRKDRKPND